jgi:hypothetical protein
MGCRRQDSSLPSCSTCGSSDGGKSKLSKAAVTPDIDVPFRVTKDWSLATAVNITSAARRAIYSSAVLAWATLRVHSAVELYQVEVWKAT